MYIIVVILFLLVVYLATETFHLKKKIKGELEFQKWSNAYAYEIKQNRENALTPEQWQEVVKRDQATKHKFENEIQPPNKPTLYDT